MYNLRSATKHFVISTLPYEYAIVNTKLALKILVIRLQYLLYFSCFDLLVNMWRPTKQVGVQIDQAPGTRYRSFR